MLSNWPQIVVITLITMQLGFVLAKHGEQREDYHFGVTAVSTIIWVVLLYYGGFWGSML